jgi:hypothetical protein
MGPQARGIAVTVTSMNRAVLQQIDPNTMIGPSVPAHLLKRRDDEDEMPEPSTSKSIGPQLPPSASQDDQEEEEDEDAWAPALPPDLEPAPVRVIGPSMPASIPLSSPAQKQYDFDDDYGPMPLPVGSRASDDAGSGVREFIEREERRKKEIEVWTGMLHCFSLSLLHVFSCWFVKLIVE